MNNLKRISIETFVILLATLVLDIQAGCTWDKSSETSCTIECSADYDFSGTETLEEVLADLEIKWQMVRKELFYFIKTHTRYNKFVRFVVLYELNY